MVGIFESMKRLFESYCVRRAFFQVIVKYGFSCEIGLTYIRLHSDRCNGRYTKRKPLTIHIVVDSEKMITEIGHRKGLWEIQLDCIRKYLTRNNT